MERSTAASRSVVVPGPVAGAGATRGRENPDKPGETGEGREAERHPRLPHGLSHRTDGQHRSRRRRDRPGVRLHIRLGPSCDSSSVLTPSLTGHWPALSWEQHSPSRRWRTCRHNSPSRVPERVLSQHRAPLSDASRLTISAPSATRPLSWSDRGAVWHVQLFLEHSFELACECMYQRARTDQSSTSTRSSNPGPARTGCWKRRSGPCRARAEHS